MLLLMLMDGLVRLSHSLGITDWVSVMEPTQLQLLRASAIYFNPIEKPIVFYGVRQPCYAKIEAMLARVRHDRPEIWNLLTDGGTLWPASANFAGAPLATPKSSSPTYSMALRWRDVGPFGPRVGDMDQDHSLAVQQTNDARLLVPG